VEKAIEDDDGTVSVRSTEPSIPDAIR